MAKVLAAQKEHKYLQVAEGIEQMIQGEILGIGDKLPSVRVLSEEYGISMGTAFQAYYHLEAKGLVEARAKSGYYVRFNNKRFPGIPTTRLPDPSVNEISTQEMIFSVFRSLNATDVINLALAAPPVDLLPAAKINKSVVHALRSSPRHCLNYEHIQGNPALRKQVARLAFNWNGQVGADDVVITAGCMEALVMCLKAVTKQGDTVAIESPTYFGIYQVIESLGLRAIEIPTDPATGVDLAYLEKAIPRFSIKACVFVPNFSNPLGSCMPDEKKKELVEIITRHAIPLIEDDIYGELYFGRHRPRTCKSFDTEDWVLHCGSLSKSLAPGYRIGWCLPGRRFIEEVKSCKLMHTISTTTLTQEAMAHFLSIGRYEYHLKNLRRALHTQCLRYTQGIIKHFPADVRVSRPEGGFVLWVEMHPKVDGYRLYQEAMKHSISIVPGQIFSASGNYRNYIRIVYGKAYDDTIDYGLKTLGELVKKEMKR
ncbi:MAG TPA: PLP-dependent aminotransferase family protein [Flavisolibacter sp.]|nr:PLP-dependent aminotransferase family protein [Flavisolibacter sp.]